MTEQRARSWEWRRLRELNIDFMGVRRPALALSVIVLTISIGSLIFRGINLGLDFTGGTLIEVTFTQAIAPDDVRAALQNADLRDTVVQNFGTERDILIRVPPEGGRDAAALGNTVGEILDKTFSGAEIKRTEFVGPAVGEELREQGGIALLVSFAAVMIYIMFRFTGKFAISSVAALFHDVIVTLGCFSVFQWTFDLAGLAAVLTVIGYSINDTIVIMDRVRENFRGLRRASVEEAINISVNQTFDRTCGTALCALFVLVSLLVLGGDVVFGFSLALIIGGVLSGTYSTVYVAANLLVVLGVSRDDLLVPDKDKEQRA
jgi:preprotein translocase subunit SecF